MKDRITVESMANPHCHLREDPEVIRALMNLAHGAGVDMLGPMPNTQAGLTTGPLTLDYIESASALVEGLNLMSIGMVTENTTTDMIDDFIHCGVTNVKVYPLNRTTKSHNGVRDYSKLLKVIEYGANKGMTFHFHPEHPWMLFENRDAEFAFLPIIDMIFRNTGARIVWEHGTDARCIPYWKEMAKSGRFYVTLTPHHLATDESSSFGDVRSVCKPTIKTERDRSDLVELVFEDHPWVMAGADEAPQDVSTKHTDEGPCTCGAFTTPFVLQLYAHVLGELFETEEGCTTFRNFTSRNARVLHQLPAAKYEVELVRELFRIPLDYKVGPWTVLPFWAMKEIDWTLGSMSEKRA